MVKPPTSNNSLNQTQSISNQPPAVSTGSNLHMPKPPNPTAGTGVFSKGIESDLIRAQIAAAKAKAQIHLQNYKTTGSINNNFSNGLNASPIPNLASADPASSKGGLNAELHPMLKRNLSSTSTSIFQKSKKPRNLAPMPKFSTIKANQINKSNNSDLSRADPGSNASIINHGKKSSGLDNNPYLEHIYSSNTANANSQEQGDDFDSQLPKPKIHKRKGFNFAKKGTFIKMGEKIRAELRLEEMKKKIAEGVKKAGLSSVVELQENDISRLVQQAPPDVEWWDAPLLPQPNYSDLFSLINKTKNFDPLTNKPIMPVITHYIQHPIPIQPPSENKDKIITKPKTLFLTKKEMKKMRRQRRQELLKDKQEKIRMGLLEPDAPKLKLSNIMRASGMQAIQDPTKMEAIAKRQMAQRLQQHLKSNQERKLTKEEVREKIKNKKEIDLAINGVFTSVYKINNLENGKLRYKININAQQLGLTGVLIIYHGFCLVVVEGNSKAIRSYKKLMLRRMNWKEPSLYVEGDESGKGLADSFVPSSNISGMDVDDDEDLVTRKNLVFENNSCVLVWEGQVASNNFKAFKVRVCPSEKISKEWLARANVESYWDAAVNYTEE
ncbi:U4/U6 small nuclear ribonucleoprotein Prp3 [Smittium culicis]|uniref:U4/U6 small nuclear ribonucleoprotein Prp3 n=1 Tax=Smittium culicis TaxID=133412 RepID=A0A1R1XMP1_9FUNG|nr:U4/U6 small nuclear ribonucleoprotein Prp3 [Smittium culicis]